jgi:hypothetical protein
MQIREKFGVLYILLLKSYTVGQEGDAILIVLYETHSHSFSLLTTNQNINSRYQQCTEIAVQYDPSEATAYVKTGVSDLACQ